MLPRSLLVDARPVPSPLDALSQATELEELDLADTISGLSFDEAQDTCEVFVDCLKHLHLKYLDLSSNALGPKGVASFKELISVGAAFRL